MANNVRLRQAWVLQEDKAAYVAQHTEGRFECDGCGKRRSGGFVLSRIAPPPLPFDMLIGYACSLICAENVIAADGA